MCSKEVFMSDTSEKLSYFEDNDNQDNQDNSSNNDSNNIDNQDNHGPSMSDAPAPSDGENYDISIIDMPRCTDYGCDIDYRTGPEMSLYGRTVYFKRANSNRLTLVGSHGLSEYVLDQIITEIKKDFIDNMKDENITVTPNQISVTTFPGVLNQIKHYIIDKGFIIDPYVV